MCQCFWLVLVNCFTVTSYANNEIEVSDVSMPEVPNVSRTAAIYLTIFNQSNKAVKLVDVSTDVARHAMFHMSKEVDGVAKMQHMDELVIPAKSKLVFMPGSYHIMLMNIEHKLLSKPFVVNLLFSDNSVSHFKVDNSLRKKQ
jgi:copper(I)-binding protein